MNRIYLFMLIVELRDQTKYLVICYVTRECIITSAFHQAWHFMIYSMLALFLEIGIVHIKWIWHFILYSVVIDDVENIQVFVMKKDKNL